MPLVSIIMPALNAAATIAEAAGAVHRQGFTDWELIVVDDGSTDATRERLATVADSRIRVVAGPRGGVAQARNLGIGQAGGELLTFLDADDLWTPDKLETQGDPLGDDARAAARP